MPRRDAGMEGDIQGEYGREVPSEGVQIEKAVYPLSDSQAGRRPERRTLLISNENTEHETESTPEWDRLVPKAQA